jgi:hypothetical protein
MVDLPYTVTFMDVMRAINIVCTQLPTTTSKMSRIGAFKMYYLFRLDLTATSIYGYPKHYKRELKVEGMKRCKQANRDM